MLYNIVYYLDFFGFFTKEEVQVKEKKKFEVKKVIPGTNIHEQLQQELKIYFEKKDYQSK